MTSRVPQVGHTRVLYQLHSDILARQSGWFRAYCAAKHGDDHALSFGWRAYPTPSCTVYVHLGKDKIQFERPSALDERTGAIIIEDLTVDELDAFLAVLYPKSANLLRHAYYCRTHHQHIEISCPSDSTASKNGRLF